MTALAPWGPHRIERGLPYTIVAGPGANVRRRCYLVAGFTPPAERFDAYKWLDADTGALVVVQVAAMANAMIVPTDEADRYAMDLDSFAEEAFTEVGWRPEPCPDRLCPIDEPHHHAARRVQWLTTPWPWDHPKARPLDDVRAFMAVPDLGLTFR